jgi:hypothetical protein
MFKTIYRLRYIKKSTIFLIVSHAYHDRLLVQENSQYFPIHLCALKEKGPTFNELVRKVERLTEVFLFMCIYNDVLNENDRKST